MRPERFRARFTGGRIDLGRNYLRQEWLDAGLEEFVTKNLLPLHAKKGSAASCFIHVVSMALSKYQAFIYIQFGRFQSYITNLVKTHHTGASRTAFMNQSQDQVCQHFDHTNDFYRSHDPISCVYKSIQIYYGAV